MLNSGGHCLTVHTVLDLVCAWHIQEWCKTPSPRARWHGLRRSRARTHMSVQGCSAPNHSTARRLEGATTQREKKSTKFKFLGMHLA